MSVCVCVCVRRRQRRTTLPLNWVVGNAFLWQLLFAGPGAKSCLSLALSLSLFFFSVLPRSLSLFLHLLLLFPLFLGPLPIDLPLGLPLRSPLLSLFPPSLARSLAPSQFPPPSSSLILLSLLVYKTKGGWIYYHYLALLSLSAAYWKPNLSVGTFFSLAAFGSRTSFDSGGC